PMELKNKVLILKQPKLTILESLSRKDFKIKQMIKISVSLNNKITDKPITSINIRTRTTLRKCNLQSHSVKDLKHQKLILGKQILQRTTITIRPQVPSNS